MELVALISSGKGTWGQVAGVINQGEWDNIILIGDAFAKKFTSQKDLSNFFISQDYSTQLLSHAIVP